MGKNIYQEDFLWFSYFGISKTEADGDEEKARKKCIQRAYLDLSRTLDFIRSTTWLDSLEAKKEHSNERAAIIDAKVKFKECGEKIILNKLGALLHTVSQEDFDCIHSALCDEIKHKAKKTLVIFKEDEGGLEVKKSLFQERSVTYGQAQKWVNMTLKNMLVMNLWEEVEQIKQYMHVPLDSYIIAAATDLGIADPKVRWSNMDDKDLYPNYQNSIRNAVKPQIPMDWEGSAWIQQAKAENQDKKGKATNEEGCCRVRYCGE